MIKISFSIDKINIQLIKYNIQMLSLQYKDSLIIISLDKYHDKICLKNNEDLEHSLNSRSITILIH